MSMKDVQFPQIHTEVDGLRPPESRQPAPVEGDSFGDMLSNAISKVDRLSLDADEQAAKVAQGEGNLHETALALEKADVAMRLMMKARNKVVDAYNEVMRMSV